MAHRLLEDGEARLGWLYDDDPRTPDVSVLLDHSDGRLVVRLPFQDVISSPYARWFSEGIGFADDPDRDQHRYEPPETLWFDGAQGAIGLVGCRSLGAHLRLPSAAQEGRIDVRMAVVGATVGQDYSRINGMTSVLPGLGQWLGRRAIDRHPKYDKGRRLRALSMKWVSGKAAPVSPLLNLSIQKAFEIRDVVPGDQALLEEQFRAETLVTRPRPWHEHLNLHVGLLDLLSLADWQVWSFGAMSVTRDSDPARALGRQTSGRQWLPAQVMDLPVPDSPLRGPRFLFTFKDVGRRGVHRWLTLRMNLVRVVHPVVLSMRQRHVTLEAHLMQVGAAVEALGFQLARDSGVGKQRARNEEFMVKAQRVLDDLGRDFSARSSGWPQAIHEAYRAVKHPDRPLPDPTSMYIVLQASRLVLRVWIAKHLGVPKRTLAQRAFRDRMGDHLASI